MKGIKAFKKIGYKKFQSLELSCLRTALKCVRKESEKWKK